MSATIKGIRSIFSPCLNFGSSNDALVKKTKDLKRLDTLESNWKILMDKIDTLEKRESEVIEVKASQQDKQNQEQLQKVSEQLSKMTERIDTMEQSLVDRMDAVDERLSCIEKDTHSEKERVGDIERTLVKMEQASWLSVDIDSAEEEESLREKN
jgi:phage gp29-like protein